MKKIAHLHYGWYIVFTSFMIMACYYCAIMNCPGMYLTYVAEDLNISRGEYTLNTTVVSVAMMVVSLISNSVFSKFKVRTVMITASVILPLGYCCYSFAPNMPVFYCISAIIGASLGFCGLIPMSILITRWFNEKKGIATGIAFTGSGAGGVILQPLIAYLIENYGWRHAYLIVGIIMFICVVPFTFLFIKDDPKQLNLQPVGGYPSGDIAGEELKGFTLHESLRKPYFWMFAFIVMSTTASANAMIQQLTPYSLDMGYATATAANMGALCLGALAVGKIIIGRIFDVKGDFVSTVIGISALLIGAVGYAVTFNIVILILGVITAALGIAYTSVGYPINTQVMFGRKDYKAVYSIVYFFTSVGSAVGSPLTAFIFDNTRSYRPAWSMWAVIMTICLALFILIEKIRKKEKISV